MNKVLKDPIGVKRVVRGQEDRNGPIPRGEFRAPSYDNRTSCSVSAGDNYGVGHRVPVGKESAGSIESGPIPQKAHCFSPDEIFHGEDQKG